MDRSGPRADTPDPEAVKRVLDAALLTRRVFSKDVLKGLQPAPHRDDKQLKPSGAQALFLLATESGLTITTLAKRLSVSQSAMSFAIARLQEAEYVREWPNKYDDRSKFFAITGAGRECVRQILTEAGLLASSQPAPGQ